MDGNFDTYEYLIDTFGEEKIKERFVYLRESAKNYIRNNKIDKYVTFSDSILKEIVCNYFADIARLKPFHQIEKVNTTKIAAYTVYWLVKNKLLQLIKEPSIILLEEKPFLKTINESFAINILLSILFNEEIRYLVAVEKHQQWNTFIQELHYFLVYRVVTPQAIELCLAGLLTEAIIETII